MNDLHDIVIATLPSIAFTERRTLPSCPGIYFALSSDGSVLYIGKSQNLYNRWENHDRLKQLAAHSCTLIAWYSCSLDQLHDLEVQLISQFQPLLNGASDLSAAIGRIGIYINRETWRAFRIACVTRNLSSSKEIERLMREQLAAWQQQTQKDPNHA